MQERGYRDKPLIVSKFGIPMPPDYGYEFDRVCGFMYAALEFRCSAADPTLGYPPDVSRLVQRWCWYTIVDTEFVTRNLFDPQTRQMTRLGQAWRDYVMRP
jgi:hypothetical protein